MFICKSFMNQEPTVSHVQYVVKRDTYEQVRYEILHSRKGAELFEAMAV